MDDMYGPTSTSGASGSGDVKQQADEAASLAAARFLLNSSLLESPALAIAILSKFPDQRDSIFEALQKFLKDYRGEQHGEKDAAKALKSFHLMTPLNDLLERKHCPTLSSLQTCKLNCIFSQL